MSWTEMEKKAQNRVVLRGNVDGNYNYVLQGIKGKGEERRKNSFSAQAKVFCVVGVNNKQTTIFTEKDKVLINVLQQE